MDNNKQRPAGWYWIKRRPPEKQIAWECAEYFNGFWILAGDSDTYFDCELLVGPRVPSPDEEA